VTPHHTVKAIGGLKGAGLLVNEKSIDDRMLEWRHHLHQRPELGFKEQATSEFVAERLAEFGLAVHCGLGGTGVVATLRAGTGTRAIGLRADIDALAIQELPGRDWGSTRAGQMHACGHDGHTATLLGAAYKLSRDRDFNGIVHFIFQPAEEHGRGALRMIEDGLFEQFPAEEIYGIHNIPGMTAGTFATRPGPLMGAEDNFEIVIKGTGGHAARPHLVTDPLVTASALVMALQTIVSRKVDPADPAVVSVTEFLTNGLRNAIPSTVTIRGDTRSFTTSVSALIEREMFRIATATATAYGTTIEAFSYTREFVPTVNAPDPTAVAIRTAQSVFGAGNVDGDCEPMMISEDFARFLERVPGNFAFIGNGAAGEHGGAPLHSPGYDFNDALLSPVSEYFCALVRERLPARA
jgi:hippurate hydrolase